MPRAKKKSPEEYIKERLTAEIKWYDDKSQRGKAWFVALRTVEIAAAALIPLLAGFLASMGGTEIYGKIAIGILGILVTVIAGALSLNRFQERWIEYRTTAESLKKEKILFETGVEPYGLDDEDDFATLVQRCETLISKENTNWAQYMMRPGQERGQLKE